MPLVAWECVLEAIEGVLETDIGKVAIDGSEISLLSKGQVIDLERVIKVHTLARHIANDVTKGVMAKMEVSGDSLSLYIARNSATLALIEFPFSPFQNFVPVSIFLLP